MKRKVDWDLSKPCRFDKVKKATVKTKTNFYAMFQKKLKEERLIEDLKEHGLINQKEYEAYKKKF